MDSNDVTVVTRRARMHYVKLWSNLLKSSVLEQDLHVRWLWIALLLEADQQGLVYGTPEALVRIANLNPEQTHEALKILMAPDPKSTTGEEEGRRILNPEPNLWFVVNYTKYRGLTNIQQERAKTAERVRRHRAKRKSEPVTPVTKNVTKSNTKVVRSMYNVDVEGKKKDGGFTPPTLAEVTAHIREKGYHIDPVHYHQKNSAQDWMTGRGTKRRRIDTWKGNLATWEANWRRDHPQSPPPGDFCSMCRLNPPSENPKSEFCILCLDIIADEARAMGVEVE